MKHIDALRTQLESKANTSIQMPEYFNFGFDVIDEIANKRDKTAYIEVDASGSEIIEHSFSDLRDRSNQMANLLNQHGLARGDFAVVLLPRIAAWYEVMIGCIKLGVVAMPGTNLLTARDIEFRINHAKATTVIVSEEHVEKINEIKARCPSLKHFFVVGQKRETWVSVEDELPKASNSLTQSDAGTSRSDEMMLAYFTSGTTANPKLVPRNHGYALAHYITGAYWLNLQKDDVHWTLSDTGWAKAAWGMLFGPWIMESAMVLYNGSGFDAELHLQLIERLKVTSFCAPPTIYRLFAQMPLSDYNLSSIRHATGAGEPLNPEVIRIWKDATNTDIHDGYGQTETVCIVANQSGFAVRPGSMGKATPGFDVQIVDDEGKEVGTDEIGHIALRMTDLAPPGLFYGYMIDAQNKDTSAFHHGFYFTGDTATRDADGYIWFVGRSDDVISSAGYRISPFEIESTLIEHAAVAESAVIGIPDELRGSIVKAFIVLSADFKPSDELKEEIQTFVKTTTAPYKYPREIEFRESLPKTISGKIRRVELRETNDD